MVDTSALFALGEDESGADPEREELSKTAENALTQEQHERQIVRKAYKEYQDNIKRSGTLRAEVIKGAQAGADPEELLLKAVDCIGCMTGDSTYIEQFKSAVKRSKGGE